MLFMKPMKPIMKPMVRIGKYNYNNKFYNNKFETIRTYTKWGIAAALSRAWYWRRARAATFRR